MQAAIFGRHHGFQEARVAKRRDARAAGFIDVIMRQAGQRRIGPARKLVGEAAMVLLEERPAECFGKRHQLPSNTGFCFAANARNARAKSSVSMHSACATASASIACSTDIAHSISSMRLVMALAKVGPSASSRAIALASANTVSGAASRLKKPQRSASSPVITRPV